MTSRPRLAVALATVLALSVLGACGSSDSGGAGSDGTETTAAAGSDDTAVDTTAGSSDDTSGSTDDTADDGSESFGIGLATVTLDGNDNRIEFSPDDGTCEIDDEAGTATVSVSLDGSTLEVAYDAADPAAATITYQSDTLDVNAGAGASTPELTDVTLAAGEMTGGAIFDSPSEGPDKTYLGEFDILCP